MGKSDLRILIGADASNFNKNIKAAQTLLVNFGNVAKSVGSSIKTALVGAFAIDSALRFFSTMIDAGRGFEDQMARVKAISNANTKQFLMMRNEAARLGETTKYSARQAAAALENLTRNGLSAEKATKALSSVLELAGANAVELAEAADIVTNTMNMFSLSVEELGRVNDVLSKTTASSATNLTDLYEALKYSAPTANLFGILIEEVNAALGILANQGIKGSLAGTTLRNVLNSLVKPSSQAADILANLGIDEVSIKLDGLLGTLQKLQGLQISDFVKIFGKEFGGITKALVDSGDLTSALKKELDGSMGEAARMFEQGSGSFNKAVANFSSAFEGAMIKVFDAVKPALTSIIDGFTGLVNALTDIPTIATAATTALLGIGTKGAVKLRKEAIATNEEIYKSSKILELFQTILNGDTDILFNLGNGEFKSDFIESLKTLQEEAKKAGFPFDELARKIKSIKVGSIEELYKKLHKVNELGELLGNRPFEIGSIISSGSLDYLKDALETELDKLKREISRGNYFDFGGKKEAEKFAKEYERAIKSAFKNMDVGSATALAEALTEVETLLEKLPKKVTIASTAFGKLKQSLTNIGKSIWSFVGGWAGLITSLATIALPTLVYQWGKMDAAIDEANESIKQAKKENDKLGYSFRTLVTELAAAEKGSTAWQSRLAILKRDYPDLVTQLKLSEVYLNSTSAAFKNLAASMDEVIKKLRELNLAEAAGNARNRINQQYLDNDYGWFGGNTELSKRLEEVLKRVPEDFKAAVELGFWEIGQILTEYIEGNAESVREKKISDIHNILKDKIAKHLGFTGTQAEHYADTVSSLLYNDYMSRAGNAIANLPNINGETFKANVSDDLSKAVYNALLRLEEHKTVVAHDASVKFTDLAEIDKYIATETKTFANLLIDEILNLFKNIKIDGKDVRDILKIDANFEEILKAARITIPDRGTGGGSGGTGDLTPEQLRDKAIKKAEEDYAEARNLLATLCQKNLITTEEFDSRYLLALGSLILAYENHWRILTDDLKKIHEGHVKYYNELSKASPVNNESLKELEELVRNRKSDYKVTLAEILGRKSGIDPFSDNMLFQEGRLEHLRGQLQDLKALRVSFTGDGFEDEVKSLDNAIVTLEKHVLELDKAFTADRLKEFKKELSDLTWGVGLASYDTFIGLGEAFINVGNAIGTLSNLDEYENDWERFVAGFQAFVSIVDTLINTAVGIKDLAAMFKELRKQKELFNAIDSGSQIADIAAIEAEAAAVVGAEATKTAAKETAAAADIATKMLQAQAAQVLMAAESAAAYAAIPFAGVGLAAALIAEMKALILAAASLPAFANGGIVGGSSFSGDKLFARVNSGEMILNLRQLKNLFGLINDGSISGGGNVEFKIRGKELVGVLNNYNNQKSKVR